MNKEEALNFLKQKKFNSNYKHWSNLIKKLKDEKIANDTVKIKFLLECISKYFIYDKNFEINNFDKITTAWNDYLSFIRENNKHSGKPIFTSQSKFEPTILEESIFRMFLDQENDIIKIGGIQAYSNIYFSNRNFNDFKDNTIFKFNTKDQDFAIYKEVDVNIDGKKEKISVPIIAMECKTYLDKTMLEGSIATAEKIKNGNPYCRFCIVTEYYQVDLNVDIKSTRIDQIYVLRKCKNKDSNNSIMKDVLELLYSDTKDYLNDSWSNIEENILKHGIVL